LPLLPLQNLAANLPVQRHQFAICTCDGAKSGTLDPLFYVSSQRLYSLPYGSLDSLSVMRFSGGRINERSLSAWKPSWATVRRVQSDSYRTSTHLRFPEVGGLKLRD
jgi:hypothetical protein